MAGQENQQYTVLYGRLSQEDERVGESNSIQHQRTLLEKYAKEKGCSMQGMEDPKVEHLQVLKGGI